jgi:hypothetical protein
MGFRGKKTARTPNGAQHRLSAEIRDLRPGQRSLAGAASSNDEQHRPNTRTQENFRDASLIGRHETYGTAQGRGSLQGSMRPRRVEGEWDGWKVGVGSGPTMRRSG